MKINEFEIRSKALDTRKKFNLENNGPIDIEKIIETDNDFTLVYRKMSENISGLCINGKSKIIVINSSLSKGRQRFTIAHELCHILYHNEGYYVCCKENDDTQAKLEKEADLFASYLLAPSDAFLQSYNELLKIYDDKLSVAIALQQIYGMSHLATLTRMKKEGIINVKEFDTFANEKPLINALQLGFSKDIYLPTNENKTVGRYIRMARKLKDENKISNGKYEELLLNAYREDLVFFESNCDFID